MTDTFEDSVQAIDDAPTTSVEAPILSREQDGVGIIYGDVGTSDFSVLLFEPIEKGE